MAYLPCNLYGTWNQLSIMDDTPLISFEHTQYDNHIQQVYKRNRRVYLKQANSFKFTLCVV